MSDNTSDEKRSEMSDRLSGRFNTDPDEPGDAVEPAGEDEQAEPEQPDEPEQINPKEDWVERNVYIPNGVKGSPDIFESFDGEFVRLQYETDWKVEKLMHYYPVVHVKGTDQVEAMSGEDFTSAVDDLGLPRPEE